MDHARTSRVTMKVLKRTRLPSRYNGLHHGRALVYDFFFPAKLCFAMVTALLIAIQSRASTTPTIPDLLQLIKEEGSAALKPCNRAVHAGQLQLHHFNSMGVAGSSREDQRTALSARTRYRSKAPTNSSPPNHDTLDTQVEVDNTMSDNEFLIRLGIGTPPQYLWSAFDSGSPDTWLYSNACCFRSNHSYFDPSASSTYSHVSVADRDAARSTNVNVDVEAVANFFTIAYADQTVVTANLSFDSFTFGDVGAPYKPIVVLDQAFGLVHNISNAARIERKGDALMGLAPRSNSSEEFAHIHTPLESLIMSGKLDEPLMSITLVKSKELQNGLPPFGGRITLGAVDDDARLGPLVWLNSTSSLYWGAPLNGEGALQMGNVDLYADSDLTPRFIIDTGSAATFLPPKLATLAHQQIRGAYKTQESQSWVLPCAIAKCDESQECAITQPLFSVRLGGRRFAIPPEDMVMYPNVPFATDTDTGEQYCLSGIQDGEDTFSVLGNTFIRNHLVVLKYDDSSLLDRQIGVALRRDTGILVDNAGKAVSRIGTRDRRTSHEQTAI